MGLLFGQERRQWAPEPVIPPYPGWSGLSGTRITRKEQAMANSTVYDCVGRIADAVAMMSPQTFTQSGDDVPKKVPDPTIVASPVPGLSKFDFFHQVMMALLLRGNNVAHVNEFDARMRPKSATLLDPDDVDPRMEDGELQLWSNGTQIPPAEVWHIRGMTLPGGLWGMSPIAYGALQMGVELSAAKFAKDFFDGGGIPKAVLETDMQIDQTQAQTLKERIMAATRNREPVALGSGVKYTPISVKPDESQFVATLQNAVATVARFFHMPPEMIGGSSGSGSLTYANREQRAIDFATYTIGPWLARLEASYFDLLPRPQFISFNENALLRMDAETQAKVDVTLIAGKVMPPSRVLKRRNEPPLTDEEKQELELVPLSVTPNGTPRATTKGAAPNVDPGHDVVPVPAPGQKPAEG